nr:hypothetical protein [Actinomadura madurae]
MLSRATVASGSRSTPIRPRASSAVARARRRSSRAGPAARLAAEQQVVGDGQLRHQAQLLVDDREPAFPGVAGPGEGHRDAVEDDLAPVGPLDAGENLDQGGLAGAVLAGQHVHASRFEAE